MASRLTGGRAHETNKNSSLKVVFDELLKNAAVDYSDPEIQDIISAAEELVKRYVQHFNRNSVSFKIVRIQPCGSMTEKTSLWKACSVFSDDKEHKINYLEFDFLMVLAKPDDCELQKGCSACLKLKSKIKRDSWRSDQSRESQPRWKDKYNCWNFDTAFHTELNYKISSMCGCYKVKDECWCPSSEYRHWFKFTETHPGIGRKCDKCTVYRDTGCLRIATTAEANNLSRGNNQYDCSFRLVWKSSTKSLLATNCETLRKSEPVEFLHISVDALPVFEIDKKDREKLAVNANFVVPKPCLTCEENYTWRASNCLKELDTARAQLHSGHQRCYLVLKCLFGQIKLSELSKIPSGYHVKSAMLNHCLSCSRAGEDYSKCVLAVIKNLKSSFERQFVKSFIDDSNLIFNCRPESLMVANESLKAIVETLTAVERELLSSKAQLSPESLVRRIKEAIEEEFRKQPPFEH